jgi:hypothetical protein
MVTDSKVIFRHYKGDIFILPYQKAYGLAKLREALLDHLSKKITTLKIFFSFSFKTLYSLRQRDKAIYYNK